MGYVVKIGSVRLPVAPEKITMTSKMDNETVKLINGAEVNVIKKCKLNEATFECLIPGFRPENYKFADYGANEAAKKPNYYINEFRKYQKSGKPVTFQVLRSLGNQSLHSTNSLVTVEEFEYEESGIDFVFKFSLKQYVKYGTKTLKVKKAKKKKVAKKGSAGTKATKSFKVYTVKKGDTLSKIAKLKLGKSSRYKEIYKKNKSVIEKAAKKHGRKSSMSGRYIYKGTRLTLPKK